MKITSSMSESGENRAAERRTQVDKISNFIEETDLWLQTICEAIDDKKLEENMLTRCNFDRNHYVCETSGASHQMYCRLKSKGYTTEELNKDTSSDFFYEKSSNVVSLKLGENDYRTILGGTFTEMPLTMERAQFDLTQSQRLNIYDYCVAVANASQKQLKISDEQLLPLEDVRATEDKPKSEIELLAEQRDMKRRRQTYRGKTVHTGNKSYTEIMHDVLSSQMDILEHVWSKESKTISHAREEDRKRSKSRTRGKDGHTKRKRHKDDDDDDDDGTQHKRHRDDDKKHNSRKNDDKKHNSRKDDDTEEHQSRHRHGRDHHSRHRHSSRHKDDDTRRKDEIRHRDSDSRRKDDDSKHKDDDRRQKDGDNRLKDYDSRHRDDDNRRKDGDKRCKDDDSSHKEDDSRHTDDDSRHKDDANRYKDDDSRQKDDDNIHRDDANTYKDDDSRHKDDDNMHRDDSRHRDDDSRHKDDAN